MQEIARDAFNPRPRRVANMGDLAHAGDRPPASFLLKKAAKIESGSQTPGRGVAGTVTMAQCRDIAKLKLNDLNTSDLEQGAKIIAGSARSMGLTVEA